MLHIGTAGWSVPRDLRERVGGRGTALERYASVLNAVEINSTFARVHRPGTFARWADAAGPTFSFSVKVPRSITHEQRLLDVDALIDDFLEGAQNLGAAVGPLLLQLPPSLPFEAASVESVCSRLQGRDQFAVACEPRHSSWFSGAVDRWLAARRIARVAADPARHAGAGEPGGWRALSYYRLHGAPRVYYSDYDAGALGSLATRLAKDAAPEVWCIFDNTASGAATSNALDLARLVKLSR